MIKQALIIFDMLKKLISSFMKTITSNLFYIEFFLPKYISYLLLTKMCFSTLTNGGFTGQVKLGHLVGLYLHSRSSCCCILGNLYGHPLTLYRHRLFLANDWSVMVSEYLTISSSSSSSLMFSNSLFGLFSLSNWVSRVLNCAAKSKQIDVICEGFIFFSCFSNS